MATVKIPTATVSVQESRHTFLFVNREQLGEQETARRQDGSARLMLVRVLQQKRVSGIQSTVPVWEIFVAIGGGVGHDV
jgi:hypothetical protein